MCVEYYIGVANVHNEVWNTNNSYFTIGYSVNNLWRDVYTQGKDDSHMRNLLSS